jgi:hypothetical protein
MFHEKHIQISAFCLVPHLLWDSKPNTHTRGDYAYCDRDDRDSIPDIDTSFYNYYALHNDTNADSACPPV